MKIEIIEKEKVIVSNRESKHSYFAWPSMVRLLDGRLALGASGFRIRHICPFGKGVLSFSSDEGKTWTYPTVFIDTVLDDRDIGLCTFGKSGLIATTFNNTVAFQRMCAEGHAYMNAYLDTVNPEEESNALGSLYCVSFDNGTTFGKLHKSPITSPHGPIELSDGTILWVGRTFSEDDTLNTDNSIKAYKLDPNGSMEYLGSVDNISDEYGELNSCEPYAIELPDGRILCVIRVQRYGKHKVFSMYKSFSSDGGRTWSRPEAMTSPLEGAPAHLMFHSSGMLVCTYSHREDPCGIRAAFSTDLGKTWEFGHVLCNIPNGDDIGYPATVELKDGSLLTIFYAHVHPDYPAEIMQIKWRL